jgi:hypothetical protein
LELEVLIDVERKVRSQMSQMGPLLAAVGCSLLVFGVFVQSDGVVPGIIHTSPDSSGCVLALCYCPSYTQWAF